MRPAGYLTEEGRVVRRSYLSADPGFARAGVRVDARGDLIVGLVYADCAHRADNGPLRWGVRLHRTQSWYFGRTRAEAVAAAVAARREAMAS